MLVGKGAPEEVLSKREIRELLAAGLDQEPLAGKRVLVIVPDDTRSGPTGLFVRLFRELLRGKATKVDFLIALGTHPPMPADAVRKHLDLGSISGDVNVFQHRWDDPSALHSFGTISESEIASLSGGLLQEPVPVRLNRLLLDYDWIVLYGPVFPHEVVGFSGGNKYILPGVAGKELIDITHWLGALLTSYAIIGRKDTPVRAVINRAAAMVPRPRLGVCVVVNKEEVLGLYVGTPEEAFSAAADLSAQVHIRWMDRPFRKVLSILPRMYHDLWTGAKGMYKVEPVVADGGEVIIYGPHITEFSYTHGSLIEEIGYHVRDYFVKQWGRFRHYPRTVLAHSTHLRGLGEYDPVTGEEHPRIQVTLATGISEERCRKVGLGYLDPGAIRFEDWMGREDEGILVVPDAGEVLYRLRKKD